MRVSRSGREARVPSYLILGAFLLLSPLCTLCDGHSSKRLPLAGIFGLGGKKDEPPPPQHNLQSFPQQQYSRQPPLPQGRGQPPPSRGAQGQRGPPPPQPGQDIRPSRPVSQMVPPEFRNKDPRYPPQRPPPPPPGQKEKTVATSEAEGKEAGAGEEENQEHIMAEEATELENTSDQKEEQEATNIPPPPPPPQWGVSSFQQPPPQQGWMAPPPTEYGGWEPPYYEEQYTGNQMFLQEELDDSLARENDLIGQLGNLTTAVVIMEQREELHIRQLDVLTERVMDVEALSAEDRNLLAEYAANCTTFGQTIATLQDELDEWQKRCNEFSERHEEDQENLSELKKRIREKERDSEDLAIAIENLRLAERREANRSRKQKKGGLLSWLLSFVVSSDGEYEEGSREEAYEMAKSTLLRALQSERGNVHELEAAVASLQQNNSAIAEMVESRDTIIDELNSRIAVFEEDKLVLKAALRQLQKEITEEAPKAQKLMDDLSKAGEEVKRLNAEVNGIIRTHQEEVNVLQKTLSLKQKKISESESNMTSIGTYVDKLEERLTSFAIKRRDIETREAKCKDIEGAAAVTETERQALKVKVDEYSKEQEELRKLLEELAIERGNLQKDNRKLFTEREFRIGEQELMQAKCTALESDVKALSEGVLEWRGKCEGLVPALEAAKQSNLELQSRVVNINGVEEELKVFRSQNVELQESYEKIQEELRSVRNENERLEDLVNKTIERVDEQEINEDTREERPEADFRKPLQPPTFPIPPSAATRDVPFRIIRKKISKATGIHGLLTPSSKVTRKERGPPPKMQQRPAMPHLPKTRVMPNGQLPGPPPLPQETPN